MSDHKKIPNKKLRKFRELIWSYYRRHGRGFAWRETTNPYEILVSEIMLQQTQTERVSGYYIRFLENYPDIGALASSDIKTLLSLWQGLGYNRRAKYLREAAIQIRDRFRGTVPSDPELLQTLPGIGRATACAIAAYAYNLPVAFLETNIRRVFIHFFFQDAEKVQDRELLPLVEECLDSERPREWYYALTDYGVMLKKRFPNPNRRSAHYTKQSLFEGSLRQARGAVLRQLSVNGASFLERIAERESVSAKRIYEAAEVLEKEGFVVREKGRYRITD